MRRLRLWMVATVVSLVAFGGGLPSGLRLVHAQDAAAPVTEQYTVEIELPGEFAGGLLGGGLGRVLRQDLDLLRWRDYAGMSRDLLERLVAEAEVQLTETLATEGYFTPKVTRTIVGAAPPWAVQFIIDPGAETRVSEVRIQVTGSITGDPARTQLRRDRIRDTWPLPAGARFRQQDWEQAKRRAVQELASDRFAGANLRSSRATIDPVSREAILEVDIDSGPLYRYGAVNVRGLSRYDESIVRNLATFSAGDPFDDDDLVLFQRRLMSTGYFSAVQVELDDDRASAAAAAVRVSVIEGNSRRVEAGVGYSTNTLYRAQFGYTDNDFLDRGWRWRSDARLETRSSRVLSSISLPARADGWQHGYQVKYEQSDISGLLLREGSTTFTRTAVDERHQPQWSLSGHLEQQRPEGSPSDFVHAVFGAYRYTRRATDDLLSPTRGTIWSAQLGAAPPGLSTRAFLRGIGQVAHWIPLGRSATLLVRAEAGVVQSNGNDGVPQSFLFRTGGDTSIRGYAFQSVGVAKGAAVVGGQIYAVGSVEAIRWVNESWGVAAFYDVGNAADRVSDMEPLVQGAGFGVRVRTPLGPVRVDLAYGERTGQVRLHLSLGVNF